MYAMDTAVHFEHRNESRRSRTESRRAARTSTSQPASPTVLVAVGAEPDSSPAHDFVD